MPDTLYRAVREVKPPETDSPYAWLRLLVSTLVGTIGGVGMWSVVVTLPTIQAEFAISRAEASLPYTLTMIGFVIGGVAMGRMLDRFGITVPLLIGAVSLSLGYIATSYTENVWQYALVYGVLIGLFGASGTFGPVIADISHWFRHQLGMALAIATSGSYLAGTIWPPIVQHFVDGVGWRATHVGIGIFCLVTILPLTLALRRRPASLTITAAAAQAELAAAPLPIPANLLQALLMVAGVACCVAMAMPQVHIVAYCRDLGYGAVDGARMLSVMLGFGIVSRLAFGWIADRIGAVPAMLLSATLQAFSLLLYLAFDGLQSLYLVTALFGLVQGGIILSYAIIVRQNFAPREAGVRLGLVLSATLAGMALGGWMSGAIFDHTLSYQAAFLNGFLWNLLTMAIGVWLLWRLGGRRRAPALAARS